MWIPVRPPATAENEGTYFPFRILFQAWIKIPGYHGDRYPVNRAALPPAIEAKGTQKGGRLSSKEDKGPWGTPQERDKGGSNESLGRWCRPSSALLLKGGLRASHRGAGRGGLECRQGGAGRAGGTGGWEHPVPWS